ncbi:MAG: glycosyltransferase family 39 protein [Variovorax sp.]|nr:glycosyltransferase family 39 protein [Variovorax sp.]
MTLRLKSNVFAILAVSIVAIFSCLIFAQSAKKFTLDEMDFPLVAKATSESGRPVYYRGEESPEHLGLYHPPLYIYALAGHIKLFGFSENTVRSFGLICTLITAYLSILIIKELVQEKYLGLSSLAFLALYLTNPYTLANTTLPDIDSTILPPLITLFILLLIRDSKKIALGGVFGLLLWAKLTTPLALIPLAISYWKISKHSIQEIGNRAVIIFGSGIVLFVATYWIYCKVADLSFSYAFTFLVHSFTKGSGTSGIEQVPAKILQNLNYSSAFFASITPPFLLLFVATLTSESIDKNGTFARIRVLLLMYFAAGVTLFYCGLIAPFGGFFKYPFAVFQLACIGISIVTARWISNFVYNRSEQPKKLQIATLCFVGLIFWYVTIHFADDLDLHFNRQPAYIPLLIILAGILVGLILRFTKNRENAPSTVASITFAAVVGITLSVSRYDAILPTSTKYDRGQSGMDETVSYLKSQMKKDEVIWSMKDVGYYTGNRYVENYLTFFRPNAKEKLEELTKSGVRFFVATQGIGEDRIDAYPEVRKALENCCYLDKNFGNFYIYAAKK